jgi:hypothetical protein
MIGHPEAVLPTEARQQAYNALLSALATHEPEALARAAASIEEEARNDDAAPPAAVLARSWLEFTGHVEPATAPAGSRVYPFTYPAHVAFDIVSSAGKKTTVRRAQKVIAAMLATDRPLCALEGPFPGYPEIVNVEIWAGSIEGDGDELAVDDGI